MEKKIKAAFDSELSGRRAEGMSLHPFAEVCSIEGSALETRSLAAGCVSELMTNLCGWEMCCWMW